MRKLFIILLVATGFTAGVYFRDDAVKFYNGLNNQIKNFQETEIGFVMSEVGKQILAPTPLNIGGKESQVVLLKSKIISETNLKRQENGNLLALKENAFLDQAAAAKANDMFANQYFEHMSPAGVDPGKLVNNYGYNYVVAGENLILGNFSSEQDVVQNWMDSPGHRENILNNRYTEIGVAIIKGTYQGQIVWIGVQEFGFPMSSCDQPDNNLKDQIDLDKAQLDQLAIQIDEKKKQIDETNPRSSAYNQMADDYNQLVARYNSLAEKTKLEILDYNSQINIFNNCVSGD
ncbi:MAG: CAP domain-containing protein [Candidatus Staskawiczbacteria bacterium]|nr:CAP domain-containing protein [Candidatus Staskawiczbacteria bacterium]